jgi:hypothetical protein
MAYRILALLALLLLSTAARSQDATKSGDVDLIETFSTIELNSQLDLKGSSVTVTHATASALPVAGSNPSVYRIELLKWKCKETNPKTPVCPDTHDPANYYVSEATYNAAKGVSLGLTYGVLAVPFKYHFSDHALTAGSTLGGFVGWDVSESGIGKVSWIVGGGLAIVSSTAATANYSSSTTGTANGTTATGTLTGLSVATGFVGALGSSGVQFGLLAGIDSVDNHANYQYNDKLWLSFSVGYNFAQ